MCNVTISNAARLYETRTAGSGNFLLSSRVIMACLRLLHSISQWFSTFSLKGAKSKPMILWD